jgi:hypothetical protein
MSGHGRWKARRPGCYGRRAHLAIRLEPVVGLDRLSVEGRHTMRLELGTRRLPCRVNDHEVDRRLLLRINRIPGEHLEPAPAIGKAARAADLRDLALAPGLSLSVRLGLFRQPAGTPHRSMLQTAGASSSSHLGLVAFDKPDTPVRPKLSIAPKFFTKTTGLMPSVPRRQQDGEVLHFQPEAHSGQKIIQLAP